MKKGKQDLADSHVNQRKMLACPQCDLVQIEVDLNAHADARCVRCNAVLYRGHDNRLDVLLALASGDALLFLIANVFPIASAQIEGVHASTTLFGAALALYRQSRPLVALLVFATTILLPALQRVALLYLLLPLYLGYIPRGMRMSFRLLLAVRPWSMVEVFLLGVLVTLVKLSEYAVIIPGVALWALAGSVLLSAALSASINPRDFWHWAASASGAVRASPRLTSRAP